MKKEHMMMVGGAVVVVLGIVLFFAFNGPSESQGTTDQNPASGTVLQGSTDNEDTLFNNYLACMADCRETPSSSDSCIASDCYPPLVAGLQELGYSSRGPDAEFISKLNSKNKAFIACSSECDYLEESEMDSCLDSCFAQR